MNKRKSIIYSIIIVLILLVVVIYTSYAFFAATVSNGGEQVTGSTNDLSFSVNATVIHKATKLIPVSESAVNTAVNKVSNNCIDTENKDVCSMYEVSVQNTGTNISLYGFVRTNTSTYITNNLKFKVYTRSNNTYTAITDATSVSNNSGDSVYFKVNNVNYTTNLTTNQTQTYYVVFWINEINDSQNDDQDKDYSCKFGFEGTDGAQLSVLFSV